MGLNRADEMLKYAENYYINSRYYLAQNNAKGGEFNLIHAIIEDIPNQFNPQTATWSLRLWEDLLGIEGGIEDISKQRTQVLLRLMTLQRITPNALKQLIKRVANANVDILRDVAPYTFQVRIREDSLDCDNKLILRIIEDYKEAHTAFYQVYNLGQSIIEEKYYFKIINRITMFWFDEDGILNGSFLIDGSKLLNLGFLMHMKTWHKVNTKCFKRVLLKKISGTFIFSIGEVFTAVAKNKFALYCPNRQRYNLSSSAVFKNVVSYLIKGIWNMYLIKTAEEAHIGGFVRTILDWRNDDYRIRTINRKSVLNEESFSVPAVTITHNLWHLDGTVSLDGRQTLDAYQIKEVLE